MDRIEIATGLTRLAAEMVSALHGMSRRQAANYVNKLMARHTRGIFSDESWRPVHAIFRDLESAGVIHFLTSAEYGISPSGRQTGLRVNDNKTWKFDVPFENERGRPTVLKGIIVASGAGSVADPLEKYDLVAYVN